MGLNSSKHTAPGPSSSSLSPSSAAAVRRSRSGRSRVLKPPSCLRSHPSDCDEPQISACTSEENGKTVVSRCTNECFYLGSDEDEPSNDMNWGESSFTNAVSEQGNTSSRRPLNPPGRFLSRFSFYPGNLSFRLTRSNSVAAARSYRASLTSNEEEASAHPADSLVADRSQGCDFFPGCFANRPPRMHDENCASNSSFEDHRQLNHVNSDSAGIRRFSTREPADRNVRFSRTLSVGRLRDRVLRRSSAADLDSYHFPQNREERHTRGSRGLGPPEVEATSDDNNFSQQAENASSSFSNAFYGGQSRGYDSPRVRETRYRDLLEHRSNFLERRRRIRSQVRALQRLGSRFENMSGHERSCILSGQHRGGHCTCCISAREGNSNDDASARASISRIVMLAEALFEVLDEIHQQSVVLSSRPSVSPIGSVPAPIEAVDSLPLKTFNKFKRKPCDEAAQCYICLIEYDDGDSMRVLPCRHEFHRACVDKWLKEIHRVCPLCRGDICRPDSFPSRS